MRNSKSNLPRRTFKFVGFSSLITLNIILLSANANSLSSSNVESANSIKDCGSKNIKFSVFNLNLLNTTQTESITVQKSSCGSIPTKSINQI